MISNEDFLLKPLEKVTFDSEEKDATLQHVKSEQNTSPLTKSGDKKKYPQRTSVPIMQSYYQWSLEKSWFLSMQQIVQSSNCKGEGGTFDFYRKQIYPKRKLLLNVLQSSTSTCHGVPCSKNLNSDTLSTDGKMNVLLSNIASVAPLMIAAKQ